MVVDYIDTHRDRIVEGRALGVEPICRVLRDAGVQIAPSTYYAAKQHTPSARALRDQELTKEILTLHTKNLGVYGAWKVHAELVRTGHRVARCTVERLIRAEGLRGIPRAKSAFTTRSGGAETPRPADLIDRRFVADAPNQLWVADLTYVRTHAGWVRRVRLGRVLPDGAGLAGVHLAAHRSGPGRSRHGSVGTPTQRCRSDPIWSITATAGFSTAPSAIPADSPTPTPSHPSAARATPATMRWPRR